MLNSLPGGADLLGWLQGIGKALADKLGSQGLNVVLVALPDALLQETATELSKKHPHVSFRCVRTPTLSYMDHSLSSCLTSWRRWAQT